MLPARWGPPTHYAAAGRCVQTIRASQFLKRAVARPPCRCAPRHPQGARPQADSALLRPAGGMPRVLRAASMTPRAGGSAGTKTPRGVAPRTSPCAPWMAGLGLRAGHQRGEPGVKGHLAGRLVGAEERSRGLGARQRASKTDLPWLLERSGVSRAASSTAPAHGEHRRGAPSKTGPPALKPGRVPLHPAPRAAPTKRSTDEEPNGPSDQRL